MLDLTGAFYDLRGSAIDLATAAALQADGERDRDRQTVERALRRGDERALQRALSRLRHANERR